MVAVGPSSAGRIPLATYRLQLNHRFGFDRAADLVDYLSELGISDLYCSPILKARAESEHGYDVVDPTMLNPQLGTEASFRRLADQLKRREMGLLLDIVPNHMAVSPENAAFMNVLEHGPISPFADWFDIEWRRTGKFDASETGIGLPLLGKELDEAIADGEVRLHFNGRRFELRYFDWSLPINTRSIAFILDRVAPAVARTPRDVATVASLKVDHLEEVRSRMAALPAWHEETADAAVARQRVESVKRKFATLLSTEAALQAALNHAIEEINASQEDLLHLLEQQVYRLCHWKQASRRLSYRRFFDITDLIGVRVERQRVFDQTHKLILRLLQRGEVTGLRVDHIDGLADPLAYLQTLRRASQHVANDEPSRTYVLVEKILEADETLEETWPVDGTTGYDFLNVVAELFVDPAGLAMLAKHHDGLTQQAQPFVNMVRQLKRRMAQELFSGEVEALLREITQLCSDVALHQLRDALIDLSAALPVYRTYADAGTFSRRDRQLLQRTFEGVSDTPAMKALRRIMFDEASFEKSNVHREARRCFIMRWQQFTGPLMAKGLEDTVLYRDARLICLNEVGMSPHSLDHPRGVDQFHRCMHDRAQRWPHTMNTTATHDTKRGEDVRARIAVLCEMPEQWIATVEQWMSWNAPLKESLHGEAVPDSRMELFLYQTALGMWPLATDAEVAAARRLEQYAQKAAREAKVYTDWMNPDEAYEDALRQFIERVFTMDSDNEFHRSFRALHERVAWYGALNSLSQVLLKLTVPGVPDLYQGSELWDLTLVDPDNRRPVDFARRRELLDAMKTRSRGEFIPSLLESWRDGRIKMFLTHCALRARRDRADLFLDGGYIPIATSGARAGHICAFARRLKEQWAVVVAPIRQMAVSDAERPGSAANGWRDTALAMPSNGPRQWLNVLTGQSIVLDRGQDQLSVSEVLRDVPCALLLNQ